MKIRNGFVSNSSSSSFVIAVALDDDRNMEAVTHDNMEMYLDFHIHKNIHMFLSSLSINTDVKQYSSIPLHFRCNGDSLKNIQDMWKMTVDNAQDNIKSIDQIIDQINKVNIKKYKNVLNLGIMIGQSINSRMKDIPGLVIDGKHFESNNMINMILDRLKRYKDQETNIINDIKNCNNIINKLTIKNVENMLLYTIRVDQMDYYCKEIIQKWKNNNHITILYEQHN